MKAKKTKTLLRMINDQVDLWKPSAETKRKDPKQAKKDEQDAEEIASKLYTTHGLVGEHKTYKIFGYGSLLNERSRSRTMTPLSVTYDKVKGYRRVYNLLITQGTCLNIEPSEGAEIDGALCEIDREDMMNFILREFQYDVLPITTVKGESAYMVMADINKGHNVAPSVEPQFTKSDKEYGWQDVLPRIDYIHACFHGVYSLAGDKNIFLTKDNVLFDGKKLSQFIEEISPTINEEQEDGSMKITNKLLNYWKSIDSNY